MLRSCYLRKDEIINTINNNISSSKQNEVIKTIWRIIILSRRLRKTALNNSVPGDVSLDENENNNGQIITI